MLIKHHNRQNEHFLLTRTRATVTTTMAIATGWNPKTYDSTRRRMVPCFDAFYGAAAELVARTFDAGSRPRMLDLGTGTGILAAHVAARVTPSALTLLDGSPDMLAKAAERLAAYRPALVVADMNDALPAGDFDVIMSSLAIHHLEHAQKRGLFARIHRALAPGGMFVNAEQMLAPEQWRQTLWARVHLDTSRSLGSDEAEIALAVELMKQDRCATLDQQLVWLRKAGFARSGAFFQWFRFAVYAAWKASR